MENEKMSNLTKFLNKYEGQMGCQEHDNRNGCTDVHILDLARSYAQLVQLGPRLVVLTIYLSADNLHWVCIIGIIKRINEINKKV